MGVCINHIFIYINQLLLSLFLFFMASGRTGICYGWDGEYLPNAKDAIALCKSHGIKNMRIYKAEEKVLHALENTGIELILGVPNEDIPLFARDQGAATQWVDRNVQAYPDVNFCCIAVGNFIHVPSESILHNTLGAMKNISEAISRADLQDQIKVSMEINVHFLSDFDQPSHASFSHKLKHYIDPILRFLFSNNEPVILANVYPYFAHINDPNKFSLPFALFTGGSDSRHLPYLNLFDYLLDALYYAVKNHAQSSGKGFKICVSESGWPSEGGNEANHFNAHTYYKKLIGHIEDGTKTQMQPKETYLFSMFDENQKGPNVIDKHFGIFHPTQMKYPKVPK